MPVSATSQQEFSDADFAIVDNGDQSKKLAFEVSGVATGTTRTWTVPDSDGTLIPASRTISAGGIATGGGDLSANRTITVTAATAADQETATSTTVAVVPGIQHRHPSAAKAWCYCTAAASILASYNMTSVTDNGTGDWTFTIATDFSSANWVGVAGGGYVSGVQGTSYAVNAIAAGTFRVICWDSAGASSVDPTTVGPSFIGFGDQ